jgi:uncharacterized protein YcbK (DUF882 family)
MGSLTKNFSLVEFACHDGTAFPKKLIPAVKELAENLQKLRDEINWKIEHDGLIILDKNNKVVKEVRINIISGYRTAKHNKKIGGAKNSYHVKAMAADIVCGVLPASKIQEFILDLISRAQMKQGGLGSYETFTHYDIRGRKARW